MLGSEVSVGQAAIVCLISMAVIFAVLFLISVMIDIMAAVLKRKKGAAPETPAAAPVPIPAAPAAKNGVNIAVLTAAVAAYLGKGTDEIVVREIRKIQNNESEWSRSGRTGALRDE